MRMVKHIDEHGTDTEDDDQLMAAKMQNYYAMRQKIQDEETKNVRKH